MKTIQTALGKLTVGKAILYSVLLLIIGMILINKGDGNTYKMISNGSISYDKGRVTQIMQEDLTTSRYDEKRQIGYQELRVTMKEGKFKGETITLTNYLSEYHNIHAKEKQRVIVCIDAPEGVTPYLTLYNYDRSIPLMSMVFFFILCLIVVGGMKGIDSAVAIVFTLIVIVYGVLPAIYNGANPIIMGLLTVIVSTLVTMLLVNGFSKKSLVATGITLLGELAACGIFAIMSAALNITGFNGENAEDLMLIAENTGMLLRELLFTATMIASLGAVMDVAMSLTASLWEIKRLRPDSTRDELFASGLAIGKDIIGTMSNTLILAFTGGAMTMLLVFISYGVEVDQLFSSDYLAIQLAQGLSGSMGIVLTVPIASGVIGYHLGKKGKRIKRFRSLTAKQR